MFDTLLASRTPAARRTGGTFVSVLVHSILIAGAAYGTSRTGIRADRPRVEPVTYVDVRPTAPPSSDAAAQRPIPDVIAAPPLPEGFQVLVAPGTSPDVLPPIDLLAPVTDPADFSGRGRQGGVADGLLHDGLPSARDPGTTYMDIQVERQARAVAGSAGPSYPESLRAARIEGRVLAQFVVDAEGRADLTTFRVLESPHARFTDAVREALRTMRFHPAEVGGMPVRQLVQMPFVFTLR